MVDVSRASGLFPDIVMGGPAAAELRKIGVVEPHARYFSREWPRAARPEGQSLGIRGLLTWRARAHASRRRIRSRLARAPAIAPQSKG